MQLPRLLLALSLLTASLSIAAADHIDTLPQVSQTLSGYADIDSIKRRLTSLPLHIIEGIWQFPADGATVVIERFNPDNTRDDGAATVDDARHRNGLSVTIGQARRVHGKDIYSRRRRVDAYKTQAVHAHAQRRRPPEFSPTPLKRICQCMAAFALCIEARSACAQRQSAGA